MRNQLKSTRPFPQVMNEEKTTRKFSNDDEGIILLNYDHQTYSSASSTTSSEELEQSTSSSSYETIKDDLKYHYYGLFESLNQLTTLANRVTEKYREESMF